MKINFQGGERDLAAAAVGVVGLLFGHLTGEGAKPLHVGCTGDAPPCQLCHDLLSAEEFMRAAGAVTPETEAKQFRDGITSAAWKLNLWDMAAALGVHAETIPAKRTFAEVNKAAAALAKLSPADLAKLIEAGGAATADQVAAEKLGIVAEAVEAAGGSIEVRSADEAAGRLHRPQ